MMQTKSTNWRAQTKNTNCILEWHKKISNFTQRYTINFYLDKKYSRPAKENLDRLVKNVSTGQKIFDPQEQISKDRYQASKVGFAYRLMEWHPKIWILKLISTTFVHNGFPNNSISSHNSILYRWNGWKLCNLICISRQSEYFGDPSQMCRGPTGTDRRVAER